MRDRIGAGRNLRAGEGGRPRPQGASGLTHRRQRDPNVRRGRGFGSRPFPPAVTGRYERVGEGSARQFPIMAEPWPVTLTQRRGASARPASYCRGRLIQPLCRRSGQAQANPRRQSGPGMNAGERRWTTPSRPPTDLERRSAEAGCRLASSRHKSSRPTADEHTEQRSSSPAGRQLRRMRFIANVMVSPPSWQPK